MSTTQDNKLDMFRKFHLSSSKASTKPIKSILHDNKTGRWLTTFQAVWHPNLDIFGVGSMAKPRSVELFDSSGERRAAVTGLTAVVSRLAFHPRSDTILLAGGNSSGRVTIVR